MLYLRSDGDHCDLNVLYPDPIAIYATYGDPLALNRRFRWHWCDQIVEFHHSYVIIGAMASQITRLTIVYTNVYSGLDQRKYLSSALLAFVQGIHRWPVNSPRKWPVTRKMFSFDDVIMYDPIETLWVLACSSVLYNSTIDVHTYIYIYVILFLLMNNLGKMPLTNHDKISVTLYVIRKIYVLHDEKNGSEFEYDIQWERRDSMINPCGTFYPHGST